MDKTISKNIYFLLSKNKKTPKDLATHLNVDVEEVKTWLFDAKKPNVSTLLDISTYFNVTLEYLLTNQVFEEAAEQTPNQMNQTNTNPLVEQAQSVVETSNIVMLVDFMKKNLVNEKDSKGKSLYDYVVQQKNFDFLILLQDYNKTSSQTATNVQTKPTKQKANNQVNTISKTGKYNLKLNIGFLIFAFITLALYLLPIFEFSHSFFDINISGSFALVNLLSSSEGYYFFIGFLYLLILLAMITVTFIGLLSQKNRNGSMGAFLKIFSLISPLVLILNTILLAVAVNNSMIIVFFIASALLLLLGIINYAILSAPERVRQEDLYNYKPKLNVFTFVLNILISIVALALTYNSLIYYDYDFVIFSSLIALFELPVVISQLFAIAKVEKRNNIKVHKVLTLIGSTATILFSAVSIFIITMGLIYIYNMELIVAVMVFAFVISILNIILVLKQKRIR